MIFLKAKIPKTEKHKYKQCPFWLFRRKKYRRQTSINTHMSIQRPFWLFHFAEWGIVGGKNLARRLPLLSDLIRKQYVTGDNLVFAQILIFKIHNLKYNRYITETTNKYIIQIANKYIIQMSKYKRRNICWGVNLEVQMWNTKRAFDPLLTNLTKKQKKEDNLKFARTLTSKIQKS